MTLPPKNPISPEEEIKKERQTKKQPEKITDPLEEEGMKDDKPSRDLDTPQKDKESER